MSKVLQMEKDVADVPIIIGACLGFYFMLFYTEGTRVVELTTEEIRTEKRSIKISDIKNFKLKDDSPEFVYLKIATHSNEKLSIGTRTSSQEELLKLYSDLKKAVEEHNIVNLNQILEKKLIYDTPFGKIIGLVVIGVTLLMVYSLFFSSGGTKNYGAYVTFFGCSSFLLFRIFGRRKNQSH
ncbi:hypothetical protein I2I11_14040 [Pontibacter sp. 172403-2]|nr:hypothetical protein [Pontibacter sp. 172403-2]